MYCKRCLSAPSSGGVDCGRNFTNRAYVAMDRRKEKMIFDSAIRNIFASATQDRQTLTLSSVDGWTTGGKLFETSREKALKLSAVNACVEVLSNSIAKLPAFAINSRSKERVNHEILRLLCDRPNDAMTPSVMKKMVEVDRLTRGNGYIWIVRDSRTMRPTELIPVPADLVEPYIDGAGRLWYVLCHPRTGEPMKLPSEDVEHFKAYSTDGIRGVSVLHRAAEVISSGISSQKYENGLYQNGTKLSGVLYAEGDIKSENKDAIRREWSKIHSGPDNAFKVAVLDHGLKFQSVSMSNSDAQFVESKTLNIEDIARFFGVPLYKIGAGKQSYNSNEQNSIEYVTGTLHPIIQQYEEEDTYKLLLPSERSKCIELRRNMMAELRGDNASRASWYRSMRETGVFSVDEIRELEDMGPVSGGDVRYASLNYVPLDKFTQLSVNRNGGEK